MRYVRYVLLGLAMFPGIAGAAYPERPITMIVGFVPGGGTDIVARALAPYIEKQLGPSSRIVVVNRPGATGEIGFTAIAKAAPDGYTIGFINAPGGLLTILVERTPQFSLQSFDLIGNVVDDPASLAVHADSPIRDLAGLAAYAKANPNSLTTGTPGIGSPGHLMIMQFAKIAGVKANHVPFKGAGDVRGAMAGKQILVAAVSIGESMQAIKGGTPLRIIAQMSSGRTTIAPDVATAKEQGFDLEMSSLRGLAAPKGLPAEVRGRLVQAVERAVADPEFQAKAIQYYAPLRYLSPAQFEAVLKDADVVVRQLWKEAPWAEK